MREILGFATITICVGALMLLGELLHWIFRAAKMPQRQRSRALSALWTQSGEQRYSIRHLERFFLVAFVWFLSLFLLITHETTLESYLSFDSLPLLIIIVAGVGIWWAYRRGVLR